MAELREVLEYGSFKDYVPVTRLHRILKARGFKGYRSTREFVPKLRELIGTDHRVRLVLNGSEYRLRGVKFTEAVLSPPVGLLEQRVEVSEADARAA